MIPELFKNDQGQTELFIDDFLVSSHSFIELNSEQIIKVQILLSKAVEYSYQKGRNDKIEEFNKTLEKGILPNAENN